MCEFAYMKLYPGDFLADTLDLNRADLGSYMLLLMAMWRQDGQLPLEPNGLAKIARASVRHWAETWGRLKRFFIVSEDGTTISQKRLAAELDAARKRAKPPKAPKPESVTEVGKMPRSLASKPLESFNGGTQRARATPVPDKKEDTSTVEISVGSADSPEQPVDIVASGDRIGEGFKALSESLGGLFGKMGARPKPAEQSPIYYSPGELRTLERLFPNVTNIDKRVADLVAWAERQGMRNNEVKIAVHRRMEKDAGEERLKQWRQEAAAREQAA